MSRPWVVLKFGGTSVASAARWATILARTRELLPEHRVWIVVSAVSQVSNRLEAALDAALDGDPDDALAWLVDRHAELVADLGLADDDLADQRARETDLTALLRGVAMIAEASDKLRARVMSFGELCSSDLGARWLRHQGLDVVRVDARDLLTARPTLPVRHLACHVEPAQRIDAAEALAGDADVVVTQGFICDVDGATGLLGRGGSDTSAALFGALLGAARVEIWTDVHGLFTSDPRAIPAARLLTEVSYREAQELAAMGAKVLHPRCLEPVAAFGIPLDIRNTQAPDAPGTRVVDHDHTAPTVLAVVRRDGVPLVSVQSARMWQAAGWLQKVFTAFTVHGISVDLVTTSQTEVTVTLDDVPGGVGGEAYVQAMAALRGDDQDVVERTVTIVSVVGRGIRTVLPQLGGALKVFDSRPIHLVSASSDDLNLSFAVDPADATRLVRELHHALLGVGVRAPWLGPTWDELTSDGPRPTEPANRWWVAKRSALLDLVARTGGPTYVYDRATVSARAKALVDHLPRVGARYYAIKANRHPELLRAIAAQGFGFECVSAGEVEHVRSVLGDDVPILFTPNFCPPDEYAVAFAAGAEVTVDGPDIVQQHPEIFAGREIALRIDPGGGRGHHDKVKTAGAKQKFGHPVEDLASFVDVARAHGLTVVGLHAHVGSGIHDPAAWARTAAIFAEVRAALPDLRWVDVGGGMGVVERPGQAPLDLDALNARLSEVAALDGLEIRVEPGRYLVSEGGVLLLPVTQVRQKSGRTFVGAAGGMNTLMRPALYGAWHAIHNLSRLDDPASERVEVVGPICETGDVLGHDRALPPTSPADVLLIENAGAYGAVMANTYNRRPLPDEVVL